MPFIPHTPESLIPRSDSRNPATTCKGITASGRPCRRSIATAKPSRDPDVGVLAVSDIGGDSDDDSDSDTGAAAFFCWQHKDQAEQLQTASATAPGGQKTNLYPLKERSSIDTLVQRLGVLEVAQDEDESPKNPERKRRHRESRNSSGGKPPRRVNRPPTWDRVQGPLLSVPSDVLASEKHRVSSRPSRPSPRPERKKKKPGFWVSLCCATAADEDDYVEMVRHKRRTENRPMGNDYQTMSSATNAQPRVSNSRMPSGTQQAVYSTEAPTSGRTSHSRVPSATRPSPQTQADTQSSRPSDPYSTPPRKPLASKAAKPLNPSADSSSPTSRLLSLIPASVPPQTASLLLTELSKPISPHDDEGYIYIFWLTSESTGAPPSSAASSLLTPPARPENARQTSELLRKYSVRSLNPRPGAPRSKTGNPQNANANRRNSAGPEDPDKQTILLKIGRASNVHRRMNEWTRQCGYSLSLVRFYPYVSTSTTTPSPTPSPKAAAPANARRVSDSNTVRKVPHAHRVERLIHIELADQRVKKDCEACGKKHREWFEVEASRAGVKAVDKVVKRWVGWAEGMDKE